MVSVHQNQYGILHRMIKLTLLRFELVTQTRCTKSSVGESNRRSPIIMIGALPLRHREIAVFCVTSIEIQGLILLDNLLAFTLYQVDATCRKQEM